MRVVGLVLLAGGCTEPAPSPVPPRAPAAQTVGTGAPIDVVDLGLSPSTWSGSGSWILGYVTILGDIDGDGYEDSAVQAFDGLGGTEWVLIVRGPLRAEKTLPEDAVASIENAGVVGIGDATGDGVVDLDLASWAWSDNVVLPGPFAGEMDAASVGTHHEWFPIDVDGDGVLDLVTFGQPATDRVELTRGPLDRWGSPADVTVAAGCGSPGDWVFERAPRVWPDVTGDGQREMWVAGYDSFPGEPCSGFLFPVPSAGTVDPDKVVGGVWGQAGDFQVVADQTGDGVADVLLPADHAILAAPVAPTDGGGLTSATRIDIDPALVRILPQPFDADGDGLGDFLGMVAQPADLDAPVETQAGAVLGGPELWVVLNGTTGLTRPAYTTAYDFHEGYPAGAGFVEDGVAAVPIVVAGRITMLELGAATATP